MGGIRSYTTSSLPTKFLHKNICQISIFLQAVSNFREMLNSEVNVDPFNDGFISLPGLSVHVAMESIKPERASDLFFLLGPRFKSYVDDMRNGLVGGPSIVFHRTHAALLTRLRALEEEVLTGRITENPYAPFCEIICGYDSG